MYSTKMNFNKQTFTVDPSEKEMNLFCQGPVLTN